MTRDTERGVRRKSSPPLPIWTIKAIGCGPPPEEFLERMESLIPWQRLEERMGSHYFQGERGRRPYPLSAMLRLPIVQLCYNLSDPAMEDPLIDDN